MEQMILDLIMGLSSQHPYVASALMIMGILRAVFKPIMAVLHAYVEASPSEKDNLILEEAEKSSIYKGIAFLLDYVASVKLPGAK